MEPEQLKNTLRTLIATFGGIIAGFVAGKGWATADQVISFLNSEVVLGLAAAVATGVWGWFAAKKKNQIANVDAMAEVAGVVMKATPEGKKLAEDSPSPSVVPAKSPAATELAKTGVVPN